MDPLTQTIAGNRSFPPSATVEHWQGAPLKLALSLPAEQTLSPALQIIVEIHAAQTVAAPPLASLAHDIEDFDGPWELEFSSAQMNQTIPENREFRDLWLVIVALYGDGRVEPLATRFIKLHRSNYSGNVAAPPAVTQATIEALTARVAALEEGGGGGGGGGANLSITRTSTSVTVVSDSGTDGTIEAVDGTNAGVMTPTMKTKLDGITAGADALTANPLSQFAATTSAQLRGVISDETGTGALVFAGGNIGAATATSLNGLTVTTSTGTLTIANGVTLTASNNVTLATDGTGTRTLNIGTGGTLGTAAFKAASEGGNGTGDSGKVAIFGADGSIKVSTSLTIYTTSGSAGAVFDPLNLTDARNYVLPDADGTLSTQEWVSGQTTITGESSKIVKTTASGDIELQSGFFITGLANTADGAVKIYNASSTEGVVTISAPTATGDNQWTFPDAAGVFASQAYASNASNLTSGTLPNARLGTGSTSITTLGTIGTGTWQATAIADAYIASASTWNAKQSAITFGTGVQTALAVNIGSAGAPVLFNGALGTPSSGTLTNCTSIPAGQLTGTVSLDRLVNTQTVGNADATITAGVRDVLLTAALTAARVYTLPAASSYPAGARLTFVDMAQTLTATNTATLQRAGSDTVNGGTSLVLNTAGASPLLISDGSSKWNLDVRGVSRGGTGATSLTANNVLLGNGTGALQTVAPGTSGNVLTSNGTTWQSSAPASGGTVDVQVFTVANGATTWTKPSGAKVVRVIAIGGGGGGGSGRRGAAASSRIGGGGGTAGGYAMATFDAADCGSTVTVTVGTGGTGGSAITADSTSGNAGNNGAASTFGSLLTASGGIGGQAGGTVNHSAGSVPASMASILYGGLATTSNGVQPDASFGGTGSAGASISSGDVYRTPAGGGNAVGQTTVNGGSAGTSSPAVAGGAGSNATTNKPWYGGGGGGGGASSTTGANGGNGGLYGGGGGGGGASVNGNNSGAGGTGGNGIVLVITTT